MQAAGYPRRISLAKALARKLSDALLARRRALEAGIAWATVHPGRRPGLTLDHLEVAPTLYVAADNDHPALLTVREALAASLPVARSGTLAALADYRAERPAGLIASDAYGQPAEEAIDAADDRDHVSLPVPFTRFLYYLGRDLRPDRVVELGTAHGVSSLHLLAALHDNAKGHLTTIEFDHDRRALAVEGFRRFYPDSERVSSVQGLFAEVLPDLMPSVAPVDLVFEDGPHTADVTLSAFLAVVDHIRPGGLYLVDDIRDNPGQEVAWAKIRSDPRIAASIEVNGRMGICVRASATIS